MVSKKFRIDLPEPEFRIVLSALEWYERDLKNSPYSDDLYIERVSSLSMFLDDDFSRKKRLRLQEESDCNRKSSVL